MSKVAKLVIIDDDDKYLLMIRSNHPVFGNDPDLPGGTLEFGEQPIETMVREVEEEAGIIVDPTKVEWKYTGRKYSKHFVEYNLYVTKMDNRPKVTMSWEHSSYKWVDRDKFLETAKKAADTYMQMVYDVLK